MYKTDSYHTVIKSQDACRAAPLGPNSLHTGHKVRRFKQQLCPRQIIGVHPNAAMYTQKHGC